MTDDLREICNIRKTSIKAADRIDDIDEVLTEIQSILKNITSCVVMVL